MLKAFALALALFAVWGAAHLGGDAQAAPYCKVLKGESVSFGRAAARKDAEDALKKAITEWSEHYRVSAKPQKRKMACKVYIKFLGEYACTAEATLCREIRSSRRKSAKTPRR
ncbi:MAG: hypothetical protein P8Y36_07290 [Alphaproteobacteria bacterium]